MLGDGKPNRLAGMANDMRRAGSSAPLLTFCPGTFSAARLSCGRTLLVLLAVLSAVLRSVFAAFQNLPLPHHGRKRAVFVFAAFLLLSGVPTVLHAQSSPSISISLSPGHQVPRNTAITATITLGNLDVNSYSSVIFRADLTVFGHGERRCNGDDTGKDMEIAVEESQEVFTAKVYDACPHDTYGNYTLSTKIFQVVAPDNKVELASASTQFLMSRYLAPGEVTEPPPAPSVQAWADPDPTNIDMYVGEWHLFHFRSDVRLYLNDHLGVLACGNEPGHFVAGSEGRTPPSFDFEEACRQADTSVHWRRAIHQSLWIAACEPGDAVIEIRHETDAVPPLYKYEFRILARPPPPDPGSPGGGGGGGGEPPTSAPGAPRNLTAVGGDGEVVLSWDAPASDGGAEITDYEYRINGSGPWIPIGSTDTTHTVTGLVNGTEYTFQVRAVNRVGKSRLPNQAETTPEAPELFTLDFTHFVNGDGITSDLVFVNAESVPVRPALYFYDTEGALVSAESLVDVTGNLAVTEDGALTVLTAMEPLGELTISTHGRGDLVSGSVTVVSDAPVGAMLRFALPGIGETVVGASPPVSDTLFPVRRQEGGITTGVAVHNLEEEAMEVSCELLRGGAVLEEVAIPLAANGQTSWLIDAAFPATDTSDFAGSVRCDAPGRRRFSAVALEMDPGTRIFLTLPLFPVDRGGGGPEAALDFAHFANGDGTTSDLVFVNMKTQPSGPAPTPFHVAIPPIRPVLYFCDREGNPIAAESLVDVTGDLEVQEDGGLTVRTEMEPLGELTISTHGRGPLVSGSVKVVSDGPIGGMLRFDLPHVGEAVVGASPPIGDAIFPVRRQEGGINTGVAIHNLESSPGLVRCELLREGVLLDAVSIPLEANGQTSWLIDARFPGVDTSDFAGLVRCDAVGEDLFSAVALEMDPGTRTFTTLSVVPVEERMSQE